MHEHKNLDPRAYEPLPLEQDDDLLPDLQARLGVLGVLISIVGFAGSMHAKGWDSCTETVFQCGTWGLIFGVMMVGPLAVVIGGIGLFLLVSAVWFVITGRSL